MAPIDEAIAVLESQESPCIASVARAYNIHRSTLSYRFHKKRSSRESGYEKKRFLDNQQEQRLVEHIRALCDHCLPPTPAMVRSLAEELAGRPPNKNWCAAFVKRHAEKLDTRYLNNLDLARHKADSEASYKQYFTVVGQKVEQYRILMENIYNMDEKGFLLGRLQKAKRVITKGSLEAGRLLGSGQDGSREWITVVAGVCADGSSLPPLLIYKGTSASLQDTWFDDFDSEEHNTHFATSPNGWTTDELGLNWLQSLFDKETKVKARSGWRLLFVDGHGSHLNKQFLDSAFEKKIMIAAFPPHATHRLQPLDVCCFAPLASFYSTGLDKHTRLSEGLSKITKREFHSIFFPAWKKAFTKHNILSSWSKTGISPFNPAVVLDKLKPRREQPHSPRSDQLLPNQCSPNCLDTPSARQKIRALVEETVARSDRRSTNSLTETVLGLRARLQLAESTVKDLRQAVRNEQKKRKRSKKLVEDLRSIEGAGALIFSPSKIRALQDLQSCKDTDLRLLQEERESKAQERAMNKTHKELQLQQRRDGRAAAAAARSAAAALKKAARERAREVKKAQSQLQTESNRENRRPRGRPKKQSTVTETVAVVEQPVVQEAVELPRSRSGRTMRRPAHLSS